MFSFPIQILPADLAAETAALNEKLTKGINNLTNRQRNFGNPSDFGPVAGRFVYLGAKVAFGNAL